jgi:hypothetical protein
VIKYEPNEPEGSVFKFSINILNQESEAGTITNKFLSNQSIPEVASSNKQSLHHFFIEQNNNDDLFEVKTVIVDYQPKMTVKNNKLSTYFRQRRNSVFTTLSTMSDKECNFENCINIIVADDEVMTRKSTIRLLKAFAASHSLDINVIEADDGIDCLSLYYKCFKSGEKISMIISDQNMMIMNGSVCAKIIYDLTKIKGFLNIPFYLASAYECLSNSVNSGIDGIYTKPLQKSNLEQMFVKANLIA